MSKLFWQWFRPLPFVFGLAFGYCLYWTVHAHGADLPDKIKTPGVVSAYLATQQLCAKDFRTKPLRNVSRDKKKFIFTSYGINCIMGGKPIEKTDDLSLAACKTFEIDHLVPLALGGQNSVKNLWPQSYSGRPYNAHVKDALENHMRALVCKGRIRLADAQACLMDNWVDCFNKYHAMKGKLHLRFRFGQKVPPL